MPPEVVAFITSYGYLAIFILIFSQEIGIPNPIPNEFMLMFCGYFTLKGILALPLVMLASLVADFSGTSLLYLTFYFFGAFIMKNKPRWIPISEEAIKNISKRISNGGQGTIFLCRLTPFVRGYTSIITGLLQMKPKIYLPLTLISAATWSIAYIIIGRVFGPYLNFEIMLHNIRMVLLIILLFMAALALIRYFRKRAAKKAE
jgi:membrane protein DedA with SNARE-associated domain